MSESSEEKLKAEANVNEKGKRTLKHKGGDVLKRDDFDAGPTNFDIIEPGLLLGKIFPYTLKFMPSALYFILKDELINNVPLVFYSTTSYQKGPRGDSFYAIFLFFCLF